MLKKWGRYVFCGALVLVIFIVYVLRLGQWQLAEGEAYAEEAVVSSSFIKLTGARGEILDRNGEVLAGNRPVYNIIYSKLSWEAESRNETLLRAVKLLESINVEWVDRLPIELSPGGAYRFKADKAGETEYLKSEKMLDLSADTSAADCMAELIERYDIDETLDKADTRRVASVRYAMERSYFSRTNPFVLARDVSIETVEVVSERMAQMPGIETQVSQTRDYGDGTAAPHVIGTLGAITEEQYSAAEAEGNTYSSANVSGYAYDDVLGQSGIESVFESTLRGKNGKETIETDSTGEVLSTTVTEPPQAGDSVWLTLDKELQCAANEALAEQIEAKPTEDCTAGAAVVLDVNSGAVLACASYPTFDLSKYASDDAYLTALYADETQPLFNRALNGIFTPGSVFKPLVALAALEEGVITDTDTPVNCDGAYHYYAPDYEPGCLGEHGRLDVYGALRYSCNSFFFDVGRMLTIKRMHTYAELFSLGEKTGCELPETAGIMSDPVEYSGRHYGEEWFDGLTIQAAIGQCDDMFTPIELATYCAMIANGGTRYKTHFLEKITDYDRVITRETAEPEIVLQAEISEESFRVVREGMRQVCTEGTAASIFADFGVAVAGKTGTAETYGHSDNLTFIGYAPYDDPEIAVAVVVEYGGKGNAAKEVAKAIFEAYFFGDVENGTAQAAGASGSEA
ncbi:MAG: penicillin-binding transpeptidase domain-containing protein [Hominenteromicrobium sp.]